MKGRSWRGRTGGVYQWQQEFFKAAEPQGTAVAVCLMIPRLVHSGHTKKVKMVQMNMFVNLLHLVLIKYLMEFHAVIFFSLLWTPIKCHSVSLNSLTATWQSECTYSPVWLVFKFSSLWRLHPAEAEGQCGGQDRLQFGNISPPHPFPPLSSPSLPPSWSPIPASCWYGFLSSLKGPTWHF